MLAPYTVLQNRYLIIHATGSGGMGTVYQAVDQRLRNTVALKEARFSDDSLLRKAFEREASLLADLRHPALPKVIDHFIEGDGQFLVMEFIPGDDLAELLKLRNRAFAPEQVLRWADQLLDALKYLHTHQPPVIHRDIKPQNLKLTSQGQIVLLDFGLAKGSHSQMTHLNSSQSLLGFTLNYAPLEQIQGTGTDPRSDLYALAATLYHLMTGSVPTDALARATAILSGRPDPLLPASEVNPQVPAAVADVLRSAMNHDTERRPSSAAEMRRMLNAASRTLPDESREVAARPHAIEAPSERQTELKSPPITLRSTHISTDNIPTIRKTDARATKVARPDTPASEQPTLIVKKPAPSPPQEQTEAAIPALEEPPPTELRAMLFRDMRNRELRESYLAQRTASQKVADVGRARDWLIKHGIIFSILGFIVGMIPGRIAAGTTVAENGVGMLGLIFLLLFAQWATVATNRGFGATLGWLIGGAIGGALWVKAGYFDASIGGGIGAAICGLIAGAGSARALGRLGPLPIGAYLLSFKRAKKLYLGY